MSAKTTVLRSVFQIQNSGWRLGFEFQVLSGLASSWSMIATGDGPGSNEKHDLRRKNDHQKHNEYPPLFP